MNKPVHWCRYVMDTETKKLLLDINYSELDALEISGKGWKKFPFKSYVNVTYPEFDVTNINEKYINKYNIIIAEQVFEHVRNPIKGLENIFSMLKSNGYFLISTPFFLKVHAAPDDYWRWTPEGLKSILTDCGFQIIKIDSWGNKECVVANLDQWEDLKDGMNLENDPEFPILVWALAKKV
jgi:SAM-dependent methyltransferase